jgi:hypothetical protein
VQEVPPGLLSSFAGLKPGGYITLGRFLSRDWKARFPGLEVRGSDHEKAAGAG